MEGGEGGSVLRSGPEPVVPAVSQLYASGSALMLREDEIEDEIEPTSAARAETDSGIVEDFCGLGTKGMINCMCKNSIFSIIRDII